MADSSKQIKQMVSFIQQEAQEKITEIRTKTEQDFALEKQTLVHNGKMKIQDEYTQKAKDLEVSQRVSRSSAVGNARVKKMKERDDLLISLKEDCKKQLAQISKSASYPELMKKLIVQGLIKIEEQDVEIQCRAEDTKVVKDVLAAAVTEYTACMAAAGHKERGQKPNVKISATQIPSTGCSGGVLLTACNNRIVLNQTLDERLDIASYDKMPEIRKGLFSL